MVHGISFENKSNIIIRFRATQPAAAVAKESTHRVEKKKTEQLNLISILFWAL